jgi:hypothetical protein
MLVDSLFMPIIKGVIGLCLLLPWIVAGIAAIFLICIILKIIIEFLF